MIDNNMYLTDPLSQDLLAPIVDCSYEYIHHSWGHHSSDTNHYLLLLTS